jgi:endo-1,4-beta-xylanase
MNGRSRRGDVRTTATAAVAGVLAATMGIVACGATSSDAPPARPTLRELAASRHLLLGAAANASHLGESAYTDALAREFNMLEAENEMKLGPLRPAEDTFSWAAADALVAFAESRQMKVRGHTFVWHQSLPAWLSTRSPAQLEAILRDHITTVAQRYRGRVFAWDVANEVFNPDNGTLRSSLWRDQPGIGLGTGTAYVEQAFRWAAAADPGAILFYNDFNAEVVNSKSNAVYAMVQDFQRRGVPIHGVGLQMHRTLTPIDAASLEANIRRLTDLGLEVHITEMDVRVPVDASGAASAADLQAQAQIYDTVVAACLKFPRCTAIQTWGVSDRYSWIPGAFPGFGAGLLFDASYRAKPAYAAVRDRLSR